MLAGTLTNSTRTCVGGPDPLRTATGASSTLGPLLLSGLSAPMFAPGVTRPKLGPSASAVAIPLSLPPLLSPALALPPVPSLTLLSCPLVCPDGHASPMNRVCRPPRR